MGLLRRGFVLEAVEEAKPSEEMLDIPSMRDELRRSMMLLVRARAEIGAEFTVTFHVDGHETTQTFILCGWWEYDEAIIVGVLPCSERWVFSSRF